MNNDGQITAADNPLRDAAMASGATDEIKDKGTEFIFHNDTLSNGIWDKEEPGRPAAEINDDDAEEITIKPGITEGEVWLDHPAIAGLSFYKTRECIDKVNLSPTSKFTVSASNPFPPKLFMRADGTLTYPDANPQFEGDLVLKIKVGTNGSEIEAVKMKLTVVKSLGAKKYFNAARDYIFENNTKTFSNFKQYDSYRYRIVSMREEATSMFPIDTYDHIADTNRLAGIDAVKASYGSNVIINGNFCFFSGIFLPGGTTNRCEGRICVAGNILRPPSDDTHHDLGGAIGRYIGNTLEPPSFPYNSFVFGAGPIPEPATIDHGLGGLSTNYNLSSRQHTPNQVVGRAKGVEYGKGVVFTATNPVGKGGAATEFSVDAKNSGVQSLNGGDADDLELLFLDGGTSVGLVLENPSGVQETLIKGSKHNGFVYYINTYLLFESEKPR